MKCLSSLLLLGLLVSPLLAEPQAVTGMQYTALSANQLERLPFLADNNQNLSVPQYLESKGAFKAQVVSDAQRGQVAQVWMIPTRFIRQNLAQFSQALPQLFSGRQEELPTPSRIASDEPAEPAPNEPGGIVPPASPSASPPASPPQDVQATLAKLEQTRNGQRLVIGGWAKSQQPVRITLKQTARAGVLEANLICVDVDDSAGQRSNQFRLSATVPNNARQIIVKSSLGTMRIIRGTNRPSLIVDGVAVHFDPNQQTYLDTAQNTPIELNTMHTPQGTKYSLEESNLAGARSDDASLDAPPQEGFR